MTCLGDKEKTQYHLEKGENADSYLCFPHRLDDMLVLENAVKINVNNAMANYYLGCLYYDKKRYDNAIKCWENTAEKKPEFPTAHRNLALAYYNKRGDEKSALKELETAFELDKTDARVLMELDQLYKKTQMPAKDRLAFLEKHIDLVNFRDDLYTEYVTLMNLNGEYEKALDCLMSHSFHPWEGGEGKAPAQYVASLCALAQKESENEKAISLLERTFAYPHNLGEGKLYGAQENLQNYLLGLAYERLNNLEKAKEYGGTRVLSGISPNGFRFALQKGEEFFTPEAVLTYSENGYNGVSQNMHNFIKMHILPKQWAFKPKPVLLNSWESIYFDISEEKLCALADCAAEIGTELLVIDDGWFSNRNDDTSSLGDWQENRDKFPNGIKAVADYVHKKNMMLGIWVEPEMISRNSRLFEEHPDWALGTEQGRKILGRSQYVLDLSRTEVQDFLIETVCSVIQKSNADYVKWDFNRMFSDFTSSATPLNEVQHRYVCGLYRVLSQITRRYPNVLFELCASGGARFDLGMLCYMPIGWVSDNTDVFFRTLVQEGTSYGYPISIMCNHISAVPNHQTKRISSLASRYGVASFGVLGLQYDLTKLQKGELNYLKSCIAEYKEIRSLITDGSFYRLTDGFSDNFTAWQLVSSDKKTSFVLLFQKLFFPVSQLPKLKLTGLHPDLIYAVDQTDIFVSGDILMKHGLVFLQNYQGNEQSENGHSMTDFSVVIYKLERME